MARKLNVAIIGAGPAGIASAIYLERAGFSPVMFEKDEPGGLLRNANLVENYPGFPGGISGSDLVSKLIDHLKFNNVRVYKSVVREIDFIKGNFKIVTDSESYSSRNVILATGTNPKKIRLRGLSKLMGEMVFFEVTKLPIRENAPKKILIIGGGDAAFDYAINLNKRGHLPIILSRSVPKCLHLLKKRADQYGIEIRRNIDLECVEKKGDGIALRGKSNGRSFLINGDYLLLACGREPDLSILSDGIRKRLSGKKNLPLTSVPGLYLVGDLSRERYRQTGIAVGDGILAAMMIEKNMLELEAIA